MLFLVCGAFASAQEGSLIAEAGSETGGKKAKIGAAGLGLEWNFNSPDGFAGGLVVGLDFNLPKSFAAGLTMTTSYNFDGIVVLEPAALVRWYILSMDKENTHDGLFAQVDIGAYVGFSEDDAGAWVTSGLRAGYRLSLKEMFFIEPFLRVGYPYIFGIGLTAGIKF